MPAGMTFQARHVVMQANPIANFKAAHFPARTHNGPGGFMPKNPWWWDSAVMNLLDVRGADPTSGDLYQQLIRANFRNWHPFDSNVINPAVNRCLH
jgi:hypothetical protein